MNLGGINPLNSGTGPMTGRPLPAAGPPNAPTPFGTDGLGATIPAAPPRPTVYPSGLQLLRDQGGAGYLALLPAGPFLPVQLAVREGADGSTQALLQSGQPTALPTQKGSDGKIYVQVDPSSKNLVVFDPSSGEYGVTSAFERRQDGALTRERAEMIAPDGSRTSLFNEVTSSGGKQFTRITESAQGRVSGAEVTQSGQPPAQTGLVAGAGRAMGFGGPNGVQENPLTVQGNSRQGYDVSGGSLVGQMGASARNGFNGLLDWKSAPLWKWLDGRKQEQLHLTPFSAMGVGAIFPGLSQASQPAAAAASSVRVQLGDITRVPADGLITAVNSEGFWAGGVDGAIGRAGGGQFHSQAQVLIGQQDGQVKIAETQQPHQGAFKNVVFVVDDLKLPLYDILSAGLNAADQAGHKSVSIPAMRLGVMKNVGGTPQEKVADMARAVRDFQARAQSVKEINFVIYGDAETAKALEQALGCG